MTSVENDQNKHKVRKFESLRIFLFVKLTYERIFIKTNSTESRFVIGPENTLFASVRAHISARKLGSERVKMALIAAHLNAKVILVVTV